MPDTDSQTYLSIGEVLGLLLQEFPDVTISKIRFLESQGLISPERTASGYRKFYEDDVELLRVILTEQRKNFLPLRVIKDRLLTGEIDPTGEHLRPDDAALDGQAIEHADGADVPSAAVDAHPAARGRPDGTARTATRPPEPEAPAPQLLPGVMLDRSELCAMVGMTDGELAQLESFGVLQAAEGGGGVPVYGDDAVAIAKPACEFLRAGIDARHLRTFRTSAEREASLYEQLVAPRFRQRNPEARAEALDQLRQLDGLGAKLRAAMTRQALGHHFKA
jgi:DNA-binding transcriptional MerR regulator